MAKDSDAILSSPPSLVYGDDERPHVYPPDQDSGVAAALERHRDAPVPRLRHCKVFTVTKRTKARRGGKN